MNPANRSIAVLAFFAVVTAGCANPTTNRYTAQDIGQIIETGEGTVLSSRIIDVEGGENKGYGAIAGAALGGTTGHTVAGNGSIGGLAVVLGGLLGAGIGYLAEESIKSREGIEYLIRTSDGRTVTLVQNRDDDEQAIPDGSPVLVQYSNDYTRVVAMPANAGGSFSGGGKSFGGWKNPDTSEETDDPAQVPAQDQEWQ